VRLEPRNLRSGELRQCLFFAVDQNRSHNRFGSELLTTVRHVLQTAIDEEESSSAWFAAKV
jgi:hypothetical protein